MKLEIKVFGQYTKALIALTLLYGPGCFSWEFREWWCIHTFRFILKCRLRLPWYSGMRMSPALEIDTVLEDLYSLLDGVPILVRFPSSFDIKKIRAVNIIPMSLSLVSSIRPVTLLSRSKHWRRRPEKSKSHETLSVFRDVLNLSRISTEESLFPFPSFGPNESLNTQASRSMRHFIWSSSKVGKHRTPVDCGHKLDYCNCHRIVWDLQNVLGGFSVPFRGQRVMAGIYEVFEAA